MVKTLARAQRAMASKAGETYVDTAIKILIAVVVGVIVLVALVAVFKTVVMPKTTDKISSAFEYNG
ncbi:MAG: DUF6133 family protein [Monoglobaceae bacterium]